MCVIKSMYVSHVYAKKHLAHMASELRARGNRSSNKNILFRLCENFEGFAQRQEIFQCS